VNARFQLVGDDSISLATSTAPSRVIITADDGVSALLVLAEPASAVQIAHNLVAAVHELVGHVPMLAPPPGTEHVGGVQWCITHHGLNDETGENHTVRVLVAGPAEGEFDEVLFEDCCDQAAVGENGTFVPCDLRDLVALPKAATT
jgi:hypothetical protein